jgi:carboxymethylenebutenolidase
MAQHTQLEAADGHKLEAYIAQPSTDPKAGVVVLQEAFGVNSHIRSVVEGFAQAGYLAIAPALFDRAERQAELGYDSDSLKKGMVLMRRVPLDGTLTDIQAAIEYLHEHSARSVGVVGYCWGGRLAWLANTRLRPDATVSYYPGRIDEFIDETPTCPATFHFGLHDQHISQAVVSRVKQAHPEIPVFTYDAGHGFNCDARDSYDEESAKLAGRRTLAHLHKYLIAKGQSIAKARV